MNEWEAINTMALRSPYNRDTRSEYKKAHDILSYTRYNLAGMGKTNDNQDIVWKCPRCGNYIEDPKYYCPCCGQRF